MESNKRQVLRIRCQCNPGNVCIYLGQIEANETVCLVGQHVLHNMLKVCQKYCVEQIQKACWTLVVYIRHDRSSASIPITPSCSMNLQIWMQYHEVLLQQNTFRTIKNKNIVKELFWVNSSLATGSTVCFVSLLTQTDKIFGQYRNCLIC